MCRYTPNMDTEKKLEKIKILAYQKNVSLDQVINYVQGIPSKATANDKKYTFVYYWTKLAAPAYKKKNFSVRQIHIRLAKHPKFKNIIDQYYKGENKKKFNDKSYKDYKDVSYINDLPTNGLFKRYKLCERLFKQTPLVNKRFLNSVLRRK